MTPLFRAYFQKLDLPNLMEKKSFYQMTDYVPKMRSSRRSVEKLDAITRIAESAVKG